MTAQGGDILAWTEAAISAAELTARQAAKAAEGGSWEQHLGGVWVSGRSGDLLADSVGYGDLHEDMKLPVVRHMVLNDPESVLRRCAADRKLMALHNVPAVVYPNSGARADDRRCVGCGFDSHEEPMVDDVNDCPTLHAVAEGYGWTGGPR